MNLRRLWIQNDTVAEYKHERSPSGAHAFKRGRLQYGALYGLGVLPDRPEKSNYLTWAEDNRSLDHVKIVHGNKLEKMQYVHSYSAPQIWNHIASTGSHVGSRRLNYLSTSNSSSSSSSSCSSRYTTRHIAHAMLLDAEPWKTCFMRTPDTDLKGWAHAVYAVYAHGRVKHI
jgi:hypothetical protein